MFGDFNMKLRKNEEKMMKIMPFLKSEFLILGKFQWILFINNSFDGELFFNFYFDITMTYFLNSPFFMHDKQNVMISKVHYE
jgi:hypothetical protein